MIITFCGHSDYIGNAEDEERLLALLESVVKGKPVDFYLGGYGNFDEFALGCTKKYKRLHPNARLVLIIPYLYPLSKERQDTLSKSYDEILYPALESVPQKFAVIKRNEFMVNKADYIFAYVRTYYGGAYRMLLYAHKHKKPYTNIYRGRYELN